MDNREEIDFLRNLRAELGTAHEKDAWYIVTSAILKLDKFILNKIKNMEE
jgi:hypothetical protein